MGEGFEQIGRKKPGTRFEIKTKGATKKKRNKTQIIIEENMILRLDS